MPDLSPKPKWVVTLPVDEWTRLLFAAQDSDDTRVCQAAAQALPATRVHIAQPTARPTLGLRDERVAGQHQVNPHADITEGLAATSGAGSSSQGLHIDKYPPVTMCPKCFSPMFAESAISSPTKGTD